ncbi:MAG: hypothetical protein PHD13_01585 [Methanocellales archaeon]|nr:hypothetical protein [Methanocellales archaeon]
MVETKIKVFVGALESRCMKKVIEMPKRCHENFRARVETKGC